MAAPTANCPELVTVPPLNRASLHDTFPDVPILWVTSWFDWYPRTISDGYQEMVKRGRKNQHLIIGPWTHNNFNSTVGDVNFGNQGGKIGGYEVSDDGKKMIVVKPPAFAIIANLP